jgi:hypothetical protein
LSSPVKAFLSSKLPCLPRVDSEIGLLFTSFFAQNVCWTNENILGLVLRFLCVLCREEIPVLVQAEVSAVAEVTVEALAVGS